LENKTEEMPDNILFNPSWLDNKNFEKIKDYCPVYTGLKSCAWMLRRVDGYPVCLNKDTLKLILNMVFKFAKFYGLWIRAGLKNTHISRYINNVLKLDPEKIYGFVVQVNIKEWTSPLEIVKFKETSLFTVKEDTGIFDDDIKDINVDEIFEGYTGPGFEPEDDIKMDRDRGELNDDPKPKRGSNNEGTKRALNKLKDRKKKKKKRDKEKKKKKKVSFSSSESKGDTSENSSDIARRKKKEKSDSESIKKKKKLSESEGSSQSMKKKKKRIDKSEKSQESSEGKDLVYSVFDD